MSNAIHDARRSATVACVGVALLVLLTAPAFGSDLEQQLSDLFVGRSFTLRNFYRGSHLHYGSDGQLLDKPEPGYWSRDGMIQISSVKLSRDNELTLEAKRVCVLFEPSQGEFSNVLTGDKVQVSVQLRTDQLNLQSAAPILQRVLLSSRDRLADLVPPYWSNCLRRKVDRIDKHSPWECESTDKQVVPDFQGKKLSWDVPPPDRSLHNGMQQYVLSHRIAYLTEDGITNPTVTVAPDPVFQWEQRRTKLDSVTLVLAFTVGTDGRPHHVVIVTPAGMGLDDDAAEALTKWEFIPGKRGAVPSTVHARVIFDVGLPNSRPPLPLR